MLIKYLETLCDLCACSGNEQAVRQYIISVLTHIDHVSWVCDRLGNLLVEKRGKNRAPHKLMISAHMDEVGMIVTYIQKNGMLHIAPIGGVDASVAKGRQVLVGEQKIPGVIGAKPIHLMTKEEEKAVPKWSGLLLDIGCTTAEETRRLAPEGTYVYFAPQFAQMGVHRVCSKAIDDRAGCAMLLHLLAQESAYDFTAAFLVQEEIGLRGAKTAAYTVDPAFALVLEATTAADIVGAEGDARVCSLGDGPVFSFMDHSTIYDRELYQTAFSVCHSMGIPCQTKSRIAGGNDSGAIHVSRGGVRTLAVSIPCRYLHSPSCLADLRDMDACIAFLPHMIQKIMEEV